MSAAEEILFEVRAGIAWLTFNRPEARNAMTFSMYQRLEELCEQVNQDPSISVMIMRGAGGKSFVSGTDISQFRDFSTREHAIAYEATMDRVFNSLEDVQVPTIAAIQGACTGGGAGIAAACDLRLGAPSARFGFPIARTLGNTLSTRNFARLAALIGIARTKELILLAKLLDAEEMKAIGAVSKSDALSLRPPFSADSRSHQPPGSDPPSHRSTDHRSPRPRVRGAWPRSPGWPQGGLQNLWTGHRVSVLGDWGLGSGPGQHAFTRRSRADV